ncbi:Alpha/Beta hydrolase protein [Phaeosphaeria sp. MPI-PUGE-AT-0046c]|nr:Alpha/Beta hydrolase protein [Phaeosphaeria sp. MPI-PUGE-AT-0046c]
MSSVGAWQFSPLVTSFPSNVLPNLGFWKATNGSWEYQIQLAWPLNWTSQVETSTVQTMYVLDGNALGLTATEAFRRRRPVEFNMPDSIVVSIGFSETLPDSPYSAQRQYDFQPPVCDNCTLPAFPGVPSNADGLIDFIDTALRPWVQKTAFPNAVFDRDALYGHSFAALFTLYAVTVRPDLFDTFLCASPALSFGDDYVFNYTEFLAPLLSDSPETANVTKPAFQISYGGIEQDPVRRRTESDEDFALRQSILGPLRVPDLAKKLYDVLKDSPALRDIEVHEYPFSDHSAVGAAALADGIDYFLDW